MPQQYPQPLLSLFDWKRKSVWQLAALTLALACLCVWPVWRHMLYMQPDAFTVVPIDPDNLGALNQNSQYVRHQLMLMGKSILFNPWQYRILSTWIAEGFIRIWKLLPSEQPYTMAFLSFRLVQHFVIYVLAWRYYRRFVNSSLLIWTGLAIMAWSMGMSTLWSDLSFNTYNDIIFYLLGVLVVVEGRSIWWLLPLAVLGAANRETILLLPVVCAALAVDWKHLQQTPGPGGVASQSSLITRLRAAILDLRLIQMSVAAAVLMVLVLLVIRRYYGWAPPLSYTLDDIWFKTLRDFRIRDYHRPLWTDANTYFNLMGTLSVLPLLNLVFFRHIKGELRVIWLALVPLWFLGHLWMVPLRETRLFLVPMVLCFIPAALQAIQAQLQLAQPQGVPLAEA